MSIGVTDII